MGEFFELQEAGILDAMGEYIGDESYADSPRYGNAAPRNQQVRNFMAQRGITEAKSQKKAIRLYGELYATDRPTFHAYNNWKLFKEFINKRVGYVAPGKKAKLDVL